MSKHNPNNLAPVPNVPERDRTTYQVGIAEDRPGKVGPLRFEEGLGADVVIPRGFMGGIVDGYLTGPGSDNHNTVIETKIAEGRGEQGWHNPAPSWAAVDQATMAGFMQGTHGTEQSVTVRPMQRTPRAGANAMITPRNALTAGERPGTVYQYAVAPPNGGRRKNEAEVVD